MPKSIVVIPDSHVKHGQNLRRFKWLNRYVRDHEHNYLVQLGDFADMESLCSYDKGKKDFEGRRYKKDIDSANEATAILDDNMPTGVKKHYFIGNHEDRINRAVQLQSELEGTISVLDLDITMGLWKPHLEYMVPYSIEGISFAHAMGKGVMGRPVGGEYPAVSLIKSKHTSCVVGHSHLRDFGERTTATGKRLCGLVTGVFLEYNQREKYAGAANDLWWRGIVHLHNVENGSFDPQFISIKTLERMYG